MPRRNFHSNLFLFLKALDAYCLLEIFEFFVKRVKELGSSIDLNKLVGKKFKNSILSAQRASALPVEKALDSLSLDKKQTTPKTASDLDNIIVVNEEPIKPQDLKIICKPYKSSTSILDAFVFELKP